MAEKNRGVRKEPLPKDRKARNEVIRKQLAAHAEQTKEDSLPGEWVPVGTPIEESTVDDYRPTVTRTVLGGMLAGLPGAVAGFAWRKNKPKRIRR